MNLFGLLPLIKDTPEFRGFIEGLASGKQHAVIPDGPKPMLLACLESVSQKSFGLVAKASQSTSPDVGERAVSSQNTVLRRPLDASPHLPMIVIVPSAERAKTLRDELAEWCRPGARILLFPELDILPYERLTPDPSIVHQRLRAMAVLSEWAKSPNGNPPVVVASAHAVAQKTLSPTEFAPACRAVKKGMKLDPAQLVAQAVAIGYETSEIVESAGTISKRGGIVDIFSPNHDHPARIEFFGNEVESLRWFNPVTQRSTGPADSVLIVPAREMLFGSKDRIQRALAGLDFSNCRDRAREIVQEDIALLSSGQWRDGLEFYAPVLNISTIVDHLPGDPLIVVDDPEAIAAEMEEVDSHAAGLRLGQTERGELPTNFPQPYLSWPELEAKLARTRRFLSLEKWGREGSEPLFRFNLPPGYMGQLARFLEDARKELDSGTRMIVVSQQASRVSELLHGHDMLATVAPNIEGLPPAGSLTVLRGSLTGGWKLNGTLLLTDAELFGFVKERRPVPKRTAQHEVFLADLAVGDYVVHVDHGIARFNGTTRMAADGIEREYLVLEYAEGDKLYVPTDQVDRVSRYVGSGGYVPALSRLNTQEWARTKERVKHATREMAEELLAIYAAREVSPGIAFDPDSPWERQLEASFPYMETPDQARTIHEVKQDMESAKPMDRLVCGDVGYGKTEIAVRAAFKAVANGMQVAVLVPTTVLAQQHYVTFTHRLAAFPVSVEMLSRFRSPKEQQKVIEGLAAGSVDICIGTHRLLQNDVVFHNLGLVIIDEEQKFGVAHKEKLKKLRSEVDVLTITATPIPRTLHMAMVGARDMSTIETAPEARLPIKTYVSEIDPQIVREAILRELDRKGQVFFVHNRVQSIGWVAEQLKDLVPEAKIAIGHGQMPEDMLESVMYDFTTGKYNVLVCTTIIESGIDLPNANTLIVNQADRLGLTQLYHLRGRVGRSDVRAYAYLFYDKGKRLTEIAQKRLKTIFEATELGAGFRIAMKDLEIRGAGNILGAEQSGQVGAVGFDLYCRLLADAVAELKAGGAKPVPRPELPTVDLPIAAHIPENYVPDLAARLALYHRLVKLDSPEKVKDLQQEIKDRFGKIPAPVENLLYGVRVKLMALKAGVQKVFTEDKQLILAMDGQALAAKSVKLRMFGSSVKVGPSQVRLDMGRTGNQWPRMLEEVLRVMGR